MEEDNQINEDLSNSIEFNNIQYDNIERSNIECNNIQRNDIERNDIQSNDIQCNQNNMQSNPVTCTDVFYDNLGQNCISNLNGNGNNNSDIVKDPNNQSEQIQNTSISNFYIVSAQNEGFIIDEIIYIAYLYLSSTDDRVNPNYVKNYKIKLIKGFEELLYGDTIMFLDKLKINKSFLNCFELDDELKYNFSLNYENGNNDKNVINQLNDVTINDDIRISFTNLFYIITSKVFKTIFENINGSNFNVFKVKKSLSYYDIREGDYILYVYEGTNCFIRLFLDEESIYVFSSLITYKDNKISIYFFYDKVKTKYDLISFLEDDTKLIAYLGRKYTNVLMKIGFSKDDIEGYTFLDDFNTNYDLNNLNNVNNDINVDYTNNVTIDNDLTFNNVPISENEKIIEVNKNKRCKSISSTYRSNNKGYNFLKGSTKRNYNKIKNCQIIGKVDAPKNYNYISIDKTGIQKTALPQVSHILPNEESDIDEKLKSFYKILEILELDINSLNSLEYLNEKSLSYNLKDLDLYLKDKNLDYINVNYRNEENEIFTRINKGDKIDNCDYENLIVTGKFASSILSTYYDVESNNINQIRVINIKGIKNRKVKSLIKSTDLFFYKFVSSQIPKKEDTSINDLYKERDKILCKLLFTTKLNSGNLNINFNSSINENQILGLTNYSMKSLPNNTINIMLLTEPSPILITYHTKGHRCLKSIYGNIGKISYLIETDSSQIERDSKKQKIVKRNGTINLSNINILGTSYILKDIDQIFEPFNKSNKTFNIEYKYVNKIFYFDYGLSVEIYIIPYLINKSRENPYKYQIIALFYDNEKKLIRKYYGEDLFIYEESIKEYLQKKYKKRNDVSYSYDIIPSSLDEKGVVFPSIINFDKIVIDSKNGIDQN